MMENNLKDDLKTQFVTREGCYRLLNLSEYSRPNRVGYQSNQNSPQVRVSFISLPSSLPNNSTTLQQQQQQPEKATASTGNGNNNSNNGPTNITNSLSFIQDQSSQDWICFNFGKELYTYAYRGVKKAADLSKPIDKKIYKGTNPSCHDFNQTTATFEGAPLLVGFTTGQIQLVYPGGRKEQGKLFNEERLIDKTKVTCLKWLPNSPNLFLAAHSSGHLYLYNEELPCSPSTTPVYQPFKCGDGYTIVTCKSKSTRNPLFKWSFGLNCAPNGSTNSSSSSSSSTISSNSSSYSCASDNSSINEFCFSPCGTNLAIASQDGFLRVFLYETMELVGVARSYFGGFLCVCWSPDSKYIVVGGEDDLVTVYSFNERRVIARCQGHRSWVSVVAFDPYTTLTSWDQNDFSDDENQYEMSTSNNLNNGSGKRHRSASIRDSTIAPDKLICYRLGSVSQDTQLCLWDITEDVLRPHHRVRLSTLDPQQQQQHQNNNINNNNNNNNNNSNSSTQCNKTESVQIINGDCSVNGGSSTSNDSSISNSHTKLMNSTNNNSNKLINCVSGSTGSSSASSSDNTITNDNNCNNNNNSSTKKGKSSLISSVGGNNSNSSLSATKNVTSNDEKSSNHSAFNTLTQRFTNFSFGSDKGSKGGKKSFNLIDKGSGHSVEQNKANSSQNCDGTSATSTLRNKSNGSIMTTYDAMKLIGTPACPRFDECPVLEPLVCKKIAHERLTALIFREDCFLTACQDGFVYTWARPHSSHLATSSPTVPHSSSTIVKYQRENGKLEEEEVEKAE